MFALRMLCFAYAAPDKDMTTTAQATSDIATFRRWLLRVHGTNLDVAGVGERGRHDLWPDDRSRAVWFHATRSHGLDWAGPGVSVDDDHRSIAGRGLPNARKWNVVGAVAHGPPLIAALSLDVLTQNGHSRASARRYHVPHRLAVC